MSETRAIRLAGTEYAVRPLTLRQLRLVLPAFARAASVTSGEGVDAAIDILAAALSLDHPEVTRDALLDVEVSPRELADAVGAVAQLSGLVPTGEARSESVP
jgi:hypothetical protein